MISNSEGIFATGFDLFFSQKPKTNAPVEIFVVTCENGTPTQNVVPGSTVVKYASDVIATFDGTIATSFMFDSPIYLAPGQEYAVVCASVNNEYRVHVATIGSNDKKTGKKISANTYNGVFFMSQNSSTWTEDQTRDLKFKLYRAKFKTGDVEVKSEVRAFYRVRKITVINGGTGYTSTPTVTITGGNGSGAAAIAVVNLATGKVSEILLTDNGDGYTSTPTVTITGGGGSNATATAELNKCQVSDFVLSQDTLEIIATDEAGNVLKSSDVNNTMSIFGYDYKVENGVSYSATASKKPWNDGFLSSTAPVVLTTTLKTDSNYLSPVINIERMNVKFIRNRLNTITGKTSRYVTRRIELAYEADQLDVYLDVNIPTSESTVKVFGKFDKFNDTPWIELTRVSPSVMPVNSDPNVFNELHYLITLPDESVDIAKFKEFKVKIQFEGENIVDAPRVKNLRAIATIS